MRDTLNQKLLTFSSLSNRRTSLIIISLLGAWIVCFPYEGQLLYTLAKSYFTGSRGMLDISLVMQVVGLILGGIFLRSFKAARKLIIIAIPVCILCTVCFFVPSYVVWIIALTLCSAIAGICIAAFSYFFKDAIIPDNRFRSAAELLIFINVLKMVINNISLHISIQAGFGFTILILGAAWFLTLRMTPDVQDKKVAAWEFDTKTGLKALFLLFLFITIISVDFGIMIETVNPKYDSFGWLTSWYWILPYSGAALIMKCQKDTNNRGNILYIAVGMIGSGFILFLLLDHSVTSYLIVNTVMMGAWAVSDVFWYSILGEMLDLIKGSAKIFSVGFSAVMLGVLLGKLLADNDTTVSGSNLPIVTMAVICLTLIILPVLHRLLSAMIKKNEPVQINFPNSEDTGSSTIALAMDDYRGSDGRSRETLWGEDTVSRKGRETFLGEDTLTEREKQIAALLLKGRTCKLIAAELYLSENTVKTHIKNIYSKLGIKSKSELFNIGGPRLSL